MGLFIGCVQLWVFSATFDNLGGGQFCLWMKLEYHNKTLLQAANKTLSHIAVSGTPRHMGESNEEL